MGHDSICVLPCSFCRCRGSCGRLPYAQVPAFLLLELCWPFAHHVCACYYGLSCKLKLSSAGLPQCFALPEMLVKTQEVRH